MIRSAAKQNIHVLMTTDAVGGVWQYSVDLAKELRTRGATITLAILGPPPKPDQQASATDLDILVTELPLDWIAERREQVQDAGRALGRLAARLKPDIIHLNSPAFAASAAFSVPVVGVCHSCVATWWNAVRSGPLPECFVWRAELTRQGYEAADLLLAPSVSFAEATARFYNLATPPLVVRNGRRAPEIDAVERPLSSAFTAGRLWDEGKNLSTVDRAAARTLTPVSAAGPLCGPNGERTEFPHIRLVGRLNQSEIEEQLSRRPVFISTARYEPFGLAVLEAAQFGCALILSDIPTFRELWNGCAIFIHPDDDESAAKTIDVLIQNPDLRAHLGKKAMARAAVYSVEAMCDGVMSAYRSLLSGGLSSPCKEAAA
jgi:glycosyltransferase involved in cell wall biosynthesis